MYTVITENDVSKWDDITGLSYHFPAKYLGILQPNTNVIYYKGRLIEKRFMTLRLSSAQHYFGTARIGKITQLGKEYYAEILDFQKFSKAVYFKNNNSYIEEIPDNLKTNYWRDGVRPITKAIYNKILIYAGLDGGKVQHEDQRTDDLETIQTEGGKIKVYSTRYERNRKLRDLAIGLHGYSCSVCRFNFKETYGEWGEGYIHVHHIKPISTVEKGIQVNPKTDLVVVCANCHSMIHRRKERLLSIEELRAYIIANP